MIRRIIIFIIIILVVLAGWLVWSSYFTKPVNPNEFMEEEGGFFSRFNPFSSSTPATPSTPTSEKPEGETENGDNTRTQLERVSDLPVAGFIVFQKERFREGETPTEFAPALRYVDRVYGHVYQTFADQIDERKLSSTEILGVYEAYFGNKAISVIMRYLKSDDKMIETLVGSLPQDILGGDISENGEITSSFLPANITDLSVSADGSRVFYLFNTGTSAEAAIGTTLELASGKRTQVFDSPFTEWLSSWPNLKIITLTTKPAATVPGYMYFLDPATKNLVRVLGEINGLTTLTSPSGKMVLYSENNLSTFIYHTDTKTSEPAGVRTLPEKCVWSKSDTAIYCAMPIATGGINYPDSWYRGEVSFSDQIWKINLESGITEIIADPTSESSLFIDAIKLALDENERYLFFINKKDSSLWKLGLE